MQPSEALTPANDEQTCSSLPVISPEPRDSEWHAGAKMDAGRDVSIGDQLAEEEEEEEKRGKKKSLSRTIEHRKLHLRCQNVKCVLTGG